MKISVINEDNKFVIEGDRKDAIILNGIFQYALLANGCANKGEKINEGLNGDERLICEEFNNFLSTRIVLVSDTLEIKREDLQEAYDRWEEYNRLHFPSKGDKHG